jgi:DeoR/GlpR family transcriptional regulator of sugar metabolism
MLAVERRAQIVAEVRDRDVVEAADLRHRFGVSPMTIRRDLLVLEGLGQLTRVHGGAVRVGFGEFSQQAG